MTVTAIANYTARVVEPSLSAAQRQEALLFLGEPNHIPFPTMPKPHFADHVGPFNF